LFNPYPLSEQPDGTYRFVSDFGIDYLVTFEVSSHAAISSYASTIFEFSFYNKAADKLPVDQRVVDTVMQALRTLLADSYAVLLYVCESLDGRQLARKRTFDNWFRTDNQVTHEKIDFAFDANGTMIYAAVILAKANPERERLLAEFDQTYQLYQSYK
jgi:hypothetical protein